MPPLALVPHAVQASQTILLAGSRRLLVLRKHLPRDEHDWPRYSSHRLRSRRGRRTTRHGSPDRHRVCVPFLSFCLVLRTVAFRRAACIQYCLATGFRFTTTRQWWLTRAPALCALGTCATTVQAKVSPTPDWCWSLVVSATSSSSSWRALVPMSLCASGLAFRYVSVYSAFRRRVDPLRRGVTFKLGLMFRVQVPSRQLPIMSTSIPVKSAIGNSATCRFSKCWVSTACPDPTSPN
ncbi:hypothetical protein EDB92DRAFT_1029569 [Lactarius akahatsu]|uniref:Uncharacterized protein n=1 Tax=Lactarius akahatsu TaxID=416441 RepID=A0AAD4QC16_9AGAM|nr:hypothetical protein EDB92DRAFT_1029569 [Lactarius akahatsu]